MDVWAEGSILKWHISGFYGWPERRDRPKSWKLLRTISPTLGTPWLCMGDFNEIMWVKKKKGETQEVLAKCLTSVKQHQPFTYGTWDPREALSLGQMVAQVQKIYSPALIEPWQLINGSLSSHLTWSNIGLDSIQITLRSLSFSMKFRAR
ncbi:hypothetical protein ACS0TY_003825 [Phlomoides rotata]